MIMNPILHGFYPDPSIVRVEDDFYIVCSSFSYFPGVPIFHSRDMSHWEQIGHVLDRESQLPLTYEMISGGIFAPTIRYHEGTFYMITTNMSMGCKNFIVTSKDPKGPWSEMHIIEGADGIDPSLFFDEDGKVYYTGTTRFEDEGGNRQGIWCSEININIMELVGERKIIWDGALKEAESPEGPHIYKRNGWYYLMIAEGGTEHYHAVTISRSKDIMGPYRGYEGNPILTHRHLGKNYPICNVGHGDMVELKDGSWYMVMLGSRLMDGYHKILGRETFLAPVTWEDGWPIVSYGTGKVEMTYPSPISLREYVFEEKMEASELEHFDGDSLGYLWNYLGTPYKKFLKLEESCLHLKLLKNKTVPWEFDGTSANVFERIGMMGKTKECISFVGRRQEHMEFEASVKMIFEPEGREAAGLIVLQNDANQLRLEYCLEESGSPCVKCISTKIYIEDGKQYYKEQCHGFVPMININKSDEIYLMIKGLGTKYSFYAGLKEKNLIPVAENIEGGFLGSETSGGFVGAYLGMFANGDGEREKYAAFDWFSYCGDATSV